MEPHKFDKERGCLLGLAVGDAIGTTLEFKPRGTFEPIDDMVGGGPFKLEPGQWTDDTSMALCLATSLIYKRAFDAVDQMNRYCNWLEYGYMSSNGKCFDIGITTQAALLKYRTTGHPFAGSEEPSKAGNGSLMRLAPIAIFYKGNREDLVHFAGESSKTTHAAEECVQSCQIFAEMLAAAMAGKSKEDVLSASSVKCEGRLASIAAGEYKSKNADQIKGSGYVVDCLEAALWCFHTTNTFCDAVLAAANLGDDADTTAAVTGQIAGAYYGALQIPATWLSKLTMRKEIIVMADELCRSKKEIKAPDSIEHVDNDGIFLAGSIEMGVAENWQERVVNALSDVNCYILNPRRDDWDSSWEQSIDNPQFKEQVEWELNALEKADLILMYFSPGTKSPITLLELGLFASRDYDCLIVCCPEGFWRKGNVDIVCRRYGVTQASSLDEMIDLVKKNPRWKSK